MNLKPLTAVIDAITTNGSQSSNGQLGYWRELRYSLRSAPKFGSNGGIMAELPEVTACWIYWKTCVERLRKCPWSKECQYIAMHAQAHLVMTQALYWAKARP